MIYLFEAYLGLLESQHQQGKSSCIHHEASKLFVMLSNVSKRPRSVFLYLKNVPQTLQR